LELAGVERNAGFTYPTREPVGFLLRLPNGENWSQANLGQFIIRAGHLQENLLPAPPKDVDRFSHTFLDGGDVLIALAAGPGTEKGKSDAWERTPWCVKLILREENGEKAPSAPRSTASLTAKVGQKIEIVPLIAPTLLRVGHDLPLRVYFNNDKQPNQAVTGWRPNGESETKTTDSVGAATFRITHVGKWLFEYQRVEPEAVYIAQLVFVVPDDAAGDAP
jgi:hypothetical protein